MPNSRLTTKTEKLNFMINNVMSRIKTEMFITFNEVMKWFNADEKALHYKPADGGWSVAEILEHISLTNFYLLILIRKGALRALENSRDNSYKALLDTYEFDWEKMQLIGMPDAFDWSRPEHMEPTGMVALENVRNTIKHQLTQCLFYLDELKNGEGVAHKTTMTVNGLGKIDVYHYIYFLVQHAKRHLLQIKAANAEFNGTKQYNISDDIVTGIIENRYVTANLN